MTCECSDGARAPNPGMQDVWVEPIHCLWRTGEVLRDGQIQTPGCEFASSGPVLHPLQVMGRETGS